MAQDNKEQKKLLTEVMQADEKDGLYKQKTALDWLKDMLEWNYGDPQTLEISWENLDELFERAKQMKQERDYELKAFWFGRGILAHKQDRVSELKPTKE